MNQKVIHHLPSWLFLVYKRWGWFGHYRTWEGANRKVAGYGADNIVEKVSASMQKVISGEAVYERDSVLFNQIEYSWEILAALMWIALQDKCHLHIIDFGGSLGSSYYQNKVFLNDIEDVQWNVVEQQNFVNRGKELFKNNGTVHFYSTIRECLSANQHCDTILFSSVLQYLKEPYHILDEAVSNYIEYILIDRTSFTINNSERITIQKVPRRIYDASYPCRFFNEQKFLNYFYENNYELVASFDSLDRANIPSKYKGFIFKRHNK
jgi:putative methyltransferase (TIGR04325 family)